MQSEHSVTFCPWHRFQIHAPLYLFVPGCFSYHVNLFFSIYDMFAMKKNNLNCNKKQATMYVCLYVASTENTA